ncbi:MAG: hypothetical protein RR313_09575 [Anaerovoracaceae bacterium]
MKNFKDFLYDKNDIVIALVILLLAAVLIMWRLDVIMAYPATLIAEQGLETTDKDASKNPTTADQSDAKDKDTSKDKTEKPKAPLSGVWSDGKLSKDVTVTIKGGSATAAVQCLIDQDLFTSYQDYESTCNSAGYNPLGIKAATFNFKVGETKAAIAHAVTQ